MAREIDFGLSGRLTDWRDFTSVLNADPAVLHAWTLVREAAGPDPATGESSIPARKGGLPLRANVSQVEWTRRGAFHVPLFSLDRTRGERFGAVIPALPAVFTILINVLLTEMNTVGWGMMVRDEGLWYSPKRGRKNRLIALRETTDLGLAGPAAQWTFDAVVIDMERSEVSVSSSAGPWTTAKVDGLARLQQESVGLWVGQGASGKPGADGGISDLAVIGGDVRTMDNLRNAWSFYSRTGYA